MTDRIAEPAELQPNGVQGPIAETARAAMTILLNEYEPLKIAKMLDVHNAHIYKCRANGRISPTLKRALVQHGMIPNKKRIRSHVEHGRGPDGLAHKRQMHAWLERNGWDSLSDAVEELMSRE